MHADFYLYFLGFLMIGMFAGLFSGLMGAGGGLVAVPGLAFLLGHDGINPALVMHVAVGTTLANMVFVASRSLLAHMQRKIHFFYLYKQMVPALALGVVGGGVLAHFLHSHVLRILFGLYVLYLALDLFLQDRRESRSSLPGRWGMLAVGAFVGVQSGVFGIGGSAFTIPFLTGHGVSIRTAVVVSVSFAVTVAVIGTITFMLTGFHAPDLPAWSTGYVYWPAWLALTVGGLLTAPWGVRLSHYLSPEKLKRFFALFLVVVGLHMLVPF